MWARHKAATVGYGGFDATLFYSLIRNLMCPSVAVPSNGWGKQPTSMSQTTIGDDVERMRELRNNVMGMRQVQGFPIQIFVDT